MSLTSKIYVKRIKSRITKDIIIIRLSEEYVEYLMLKTEHYTVKQSGTIKTPMICLYDTNVMYYR